MRRICPKYGEIQTGMYFFCIHRRPGTMDNECEELPVFQQYLGKYATYKYMYNMSLEKCYCSASADVCCIKIHAEMTEILQVKD